MGGAGKRGRWVERLAGYITGENGRLKRESLNATLRVFRKLVKVTLGVCYDGELEISAERFMAICSVCNNRIPDGAKYCHICNHWQSKWRRTFTFIAGISGAITIFAAFFTYILANVDDVYNSIGKRESLQLLSFNSRGTTKMFNESDDYIWVIQAEVNGNDGGEKIKFSQGFDIIIGPKKFSEKKFPHECASGMAVTNSIIEHKNMTEPILSRLKQKFKCVELVSVTESDPTYFQYSRFLRKDMITRDATIIIHYRHTGDSSVTKKTIDGKIYFTVEIDSERNPILKE